MVSPPTLETPASTSDERTARKAGIAAALATSLEWYDFYIYGTAAALVFNETYFATDSEVVAAVSSFATVAVGFIARPIGGVVAGHFGDKVGRKPVLVASTLLMGLATVLIGFVPETSTVWLAPTLLVILRITQGLAVGGQWGGAVLLATEYAPPHRRGFYGSFPQLGIPIGLILGNGIFLVLTWLTSPDAFMAWGWRIPFWISAVIVLVAMGIHRYLEETPEFQRVEAKMAVNTPRRSPVIQVLRHNFSTVALAAGTYLIGIAMFYLTITGSIQVATTNLGMSRSDTLWIVLVSAAVLIPLGPLSAHLSDKYGRKLIYGIGIALMGVWAIPMWLLIAHAGPGTTWPLAVALIMSCVAMAFQTGPQPALFAEIFPAELRYSGATLGYQFAAIVGGMSPMVMVAVINGQVDNIWRIGPVLTLLAVIALASLYALHLRQARTPSAA
ncbi:MFS transporter [Gordonia hydrophobica]|uniref:MFS transporter n=1 Tax=Gordonia hydrophobica TaxID=40516 RepID=A0ABZ2U3D7_9ACTN|nr:MFS transporter [Gordonia hydrophobica]MBM7366889.1 MFS family permease [Gordonia hydrophobica]